MEQALEFTEILKSAYAAKLEPVPLNPYTSDADASKNLNSVKTSLK
jgi:hypothetical protein